MYLKYYHNVDILLDLTHVSSSYSLFSGIVGCQYLKMNNNNNFIIVQLIRIQSCLGQEIERRSNTIDLMRYFVEVLHTY